MSPEEFDTFIGPEPQRVLEWSCRNGNTIEFSLQVLYPLAPCKLEYVCRQLEMALELLRNEESGGIA